MSPFLLPRGLEMITIDAIYENGVLKPAHPLPFGEQEKVRVTVEVVPKEETRLTPEEAEAHVRRSQGLIKWTGDWETFRRIAEDPEFGMWERE